MTAHQSIKPAPDRAASGRLFVLELNAGKIHVFNPGGSDKKTIVAGANNPDGIAVDVEAGHIYWTNMGNPKLNDGSIERADLDGGNRVTIVPPGGTFTPKQLQLEKTGGKLYWADREGMRVMRANLDGSAIETLVETGRGDADRADAANWCVGVAVDPGCGELYWTQKGPDNGERGRLCRAPLEPLTRQDPAARTDIEILFDQLPEPIDLDIDADNRFLYWTDRGNPPRGNSVNRTDIDADPGKAGPPEIVLTDLMEGIGIALDLGGNRMFVTDFAGSIYTARLDGSDRRTLAQAQGNLTGIAYAEVPTEK